jgi:hypothetical protein
MRVADLGTGRTGTVHAISTYDYDDAPGTVFLIPLGGGIGWEAQITHLRPAGQETPR